MWLGFSNNYIIQVFCTDYYCDKRIDGETDNFLRLEEDNEMILRFDSMTGNLAKGTTGRFIAGICFDNTNCSNNIIDFYYFINF